MNILNIKYIETEDTETWDNPKIILEVDNTLCKFEKNNIIRIINQDQCHIADLDEIREFIHEYDFKDGLWLIEISISWIKIITYDGDDFDPQWNFKKELKLYG